MATPLFESHLPLSGRRQGKVRDIYDATLANDQKALVIIASDRMSAFDVVMTTPIAGKGIVLTQLSVFWFDMIQKKLGSQLDHHLISTSPADIPGLNAAEQQAIDRRLMIGKKTRVVPIECVVRGYLAGSGWKEYQENQTVCGVKLPAGLKQCDKLPQPIFTPATKEESGHDMNVSFEETANIIGVQLATKLRDLSIAIYTMAADYALTKGIIIADTKFEFGLPLDSNGYDNLTPILIDEVLTPDSSRFWPADKYEAGRDQESFDKQFTRNYLQDLCDAGRWNKTAPGPNLPKEIVNGSLAKYLEAYTLLTGTKLSV